MLKLQKETINKLNKFCSTKTMEAKQNNLAKSDGKKIGRTTQITFKDNLFGESCILRNTR